MANRESNTLQSIVREHVRRRAKIMSDEHAGYNGLEDDYLRGAINRAVAYVDGTVHTNGVENYWSLLKGGLNGTYVSVEPFHLFRYLDEQAFRFNNRGDDSRKDARGRAVERTDAERLRILAGQTSGKRSTYHALTGKEGETAAF